MIAKPSRSQLKQWKRLSLAKYRRREGRFLAEGVKVVAELLASGRPAEALLIGEASAEKERGILARVPAGLPVYRLSAQEWGEMSQDPAPEEVMAVAPAAPVVPLDALSGPLLLLYRINNPNNLGALLRTAHWFGFQTVLLSEGSCEATNPKAVRTSMGSLFHLAVVEDLAFEALLPYIRERFHLVGSDVRQGDAPHGCGPATALLMGSESHGLPEKLLVQAHERWRIRGAGGAESLSLPQAAAIMMYECVRKPEM